MLKELDRLWSLTGSQRAGYSGIENTYFDRVGLNLQPHLECFDYYCSPINTFTFACTGGGGIHFGFLQTDSSPLDLSPVILTIPGDKEPNVIVGSNLLEFLSLGCYSGYFEFENFNYLLSEGSNLFDGSRYSDELNAEEIRLLKQIQLEFQLRPWGDPRKKLKLLKDKYFGLLEYRDDYEETHRLFHR